MLVSCKAQLLNFQSHYSLMEIAPMNTTQYDLLCDTIAGMADMYEFLNAKNRKRFHELRAIARLQRSLICAEAGCHCGTCLDIPDMDELLAGGDWGS